MMETGKLLLVVGGLIFVIGLFLMFGQKFTFLGRLPGDILIKKENTTFYFPITTGIVISIILTIVMNILKK